MFGKNKKKENPPKSANQANAVDAARPKEYSDDILRNDITDPGKKEETGGGHTRPNQVGTEGLNASDFKPEKLENKKYFGKKR